MNEVSIYRVGLFADLKLVRYSWRKRRYVRMFQILKSIPFDKSNWRRNYLNGWLAEDVHATRNAGHGWTPARARRSWERNEILP